MKTQDRPVERIEIKTSKLEFTVRKDTGFIDGLKYRKGSRLFGKWVEAVPEDKAKGLFMKLLSQGDYTGRTSLISGDIKNVEMVAEAVKVSESKGKGGKEISVETQGVLKLDGVSIGSFTSRINVVDGQSYLLVDVDFQDIKAPPGKFLAEAGLILPMNLKEDKTIVTPGDRGIVFDSLYTYEYEKPGESGNKVSPPDISRWGIFMVEQESPTSFKMWKAEGEETNSVTMMYGKEAPGWAGAQDGDIGVAVAYRDFAMRAPSGLRIIGHGGGEAQVLFHPSTSRPKPLDELKTSHQVALYFYDGNWQESGERGVSVERKIGSLFDVDAFPSEGQIRRYPEPEESRKVPIRQDAVMVKGGVPLPRGEVTSKDEVRLMRGDKEVPLQSDILGYWPDGSIKWLLLTFPMDGSYTFTPGTSGKSSHIPINVSTRMGTVEEFTLYYGPGVQKGEIDQGIKTAVDGDKIVVDTGELSFTIRRDGTGFLDEVLLGSNVFISPGEDDRTFINYVHTRDYHVGNATIKGEYDPSSVAVDSIELEENGPLRAVVLVQGRYYNSKGGFETPFTMRLEAFAGESYVRVSHTFLYTANDAYRDFLTSLGLRLPIETHGKVSVTLGDEDGPFEAGTRGGLYQLSSMGYELWGERDGKVDTMKHGSKSTGWVDMSWDGGGITVVMRNMYKEFPKELVADGETGQVIAYLWPESASPMDMRRYSDTPHRAQGESVTRYLDPDYLKHLPYGIGKTHELLFYFHDGGDGKESIESLAMDFDDPTLVYVTPEWYASTGVFGDLSVPDNERFPDAAKAERNLESIQDFFLFHQDYWNWYGMWNYGDFQHSFARGYGWGPKHGSYKPQHGWAFDNGRWGWTNSEGQPGLGLALMYLRTGKREYYFAAEAMANHIRDVDVHHAGPLKGGGIRHNVQHWGDGNREERHGNPIAYLVPYFLSGNPRTRDVVTELVHEKYLIGVQSVHAQHGARFNGILMMWEMTGDEKYQKILENYIQAFIADEGIYISPTVAFPEGVLAGGRDNLNSGDMFFHNFGALHAIIRYHDITGHEALRKALIKMAEKMNSDSLQHLLINSFAAKWSPEPRRFRTRVETAVHNNYRVALSAVPEDMDDWIESKNVFLGREMSQIAVTWFVNDMVYTLNVIESPIGPSALRK